MSNGSWFLPETLVRRTDHDSLGLLIACRFDSLTSFFDSLSSRHKGMEKIAASADIPMLIDMEVANQGGARSQHNHLNPSPLE
ncbi:hypothetical protein V2J09_013249 [Rumex salicifolius]